MALTHAIASSLPASRGFFARIVLALRVRQERRHLAELDDALLADIGLTRTQVQDEAKRTMWDLPYQRSPR
ncbi:hypothetical protein BVG79_01854 [Ketogulonicigenium robustum]|uniref:YjiS-like domain-containing protein n=1 Tax=Ketogulonicigenium robustum TaxID=92947 RepID=A0A1W6P106_9RHOB|nr:DUF1127 domain-containing protein [Ketogulonicigenium robustum]ARO15196.1 hypothetical protein BVG79_01854 [Ketogulonicigenium robustum]